MLKLFKSKSSHFKDNFLYAILTSDSITIKSKIQEKESETIEHSLKSRVHGEELYLQNIADVLRDELSWMSVDKNTQFAFLLDKSILDKESFGLPSMPKGEEKEAIAWEVLESVRLEKGSYYSVVEKYSETEENECHYTVYAVDKSFITTLAGMTQGFGIKLAFIAPYERNKSFEEMSKQNFLPQELKASEMNVVLTKWGKYFAFACLVIAAFAIFGLEIFIYNVKNDLHNLEKSLQAEAFWQENFKQTNAMERKNKRINAAIKRLDDTTIKHSKILEALGRATVPGLWIISVEAEELNYKITGRSVDMLGLNAWLEELSLNSNFKHSKVLSTEVKSLGISFNVIVSEKTVM